LSIWALILYIYVGLNLAYAPFALAKKKEFKFDQTNGATAVAAVLFTVVTIALSWVIYELYVDSTYANALVAAVILWAIRGVVLVSQLVVCAKGRERYSVASFWFDCFIGGASLVAISMLAFA
jgi:hypothetical protein